MYRKANTCEYRVLFRGTNVTVDQATGVSDFIDRLYTAMSDVSCDLSANDLTIPGLVLAPIQFGSANLIAGVPSQPVDFPPVKNMHIGFTMSAIRYLNPIANKITADGCGGGNLKLTVSGHSLGGGVSAVAAPLLNRMYPNASVELVTFASPRITTSAPFNSAIGLQGTPTHYYLQGPNYGDPVPILPFNTLGSGILTETWQPLEGNHIGLAPTANDYNGITIHFPNYYKDTVNNFCDNIDALQPAPTLAPPSYALADALILEVNKFIDRVVTTVDAAIDEVHAIANDVSVVINHEPATGDPNFRHPWENRALWCAEDTGFGNRARVRYKSNHIQTPEYESCVACCAADGSARPTYKCADLCKQRCPNCFYGSVYRPENCTYNSFISAGQTLPAGTSICSSDGLWRAFNQTDGNFVVYSAGGSGGMSGGETAHWASNTHDNVPGAIVYQGDGNLVMYKSGRAVWSTGTAGRTCGPDCQLWMQSDSNLVLYQNNSPYWARW
jgi:hypothetical protein